MVRVCELLQPALPNGKVCAHAQGFISTQNIRYQSFENVKTAKKKKTKINEKLIKEMTCTIEAFVFLQLKTQNSFNAIFKHSKMKSAGNHLFQKIDKIDMSHSDYLQLCVKSNM